MNLSEYLFCVRLFLNKETGAIVVMDFSPHFAKQLFGFFNSKSC